MWLRSSQSLLRAGDSRSIFPILQMSTLRLRSDLFKVTELGSGRAGSWDFFLLFFNNRAKFIQWKEHPFFGNYPFYPYFWYYTILKKNHSVGRCHSLTVGPFGLYHKKLGILYLVTRFDQRFSLLGEAREKVTCRASSSSNSGNMFLSRLGFYKIL